MTAPGFAGVPERALDFYDDLEADNSKAFWSEHRTTYDEAVRAPMLALAERLAPEFGDAVLFRPHRDVRFSKDKSPYKTHQGAFVGTADGVGLYVQVSAAGLLTAGGWHPRGEQVRRYREAVAGPTGAELDRLVRGLERAGFRIEGDRLATRPRGQPPGHPREPLLRHKSLTAAREHGSPGWLHGPEAAEKVAADWRTLGPLVAWLAAHVGPGEPAS
ncbi:MAG: DUF2461 domain-containing protein [Actinomycetes bacterium]